jgi:hypothetical protein
MGGFLRTFRPRTASAADPTVATLLWALVGCAVAILIASILLEEKEIREIGLAAIAGVVLLLGAYFTARNLRQTSHSSFVSNLLQAAELFADPNPVKREAGRQALDYLAAQLPSGDGDDQARKAAALAVLEAGTDLPATDES